MPIFFQLCPSEGGVRATRISPIHWSCSTGTYTMTIVWAPSVWVEPWIFGVSNTKNKYQRTFCDFGAEVVSVWYPRRTRFWPWLMSLRHLFLHVTGERRENTICIRSQAMTFYNGSSLSSITLSQKPQYDNRDGTLELTSRNCSAIHSRGSCVAW